MSWHPVERERWREHAVPQLRVLAKEMGVCPVELLLAVGIEWRAISELRGDLPLRPGTAAAVSFVVDSLAEQAQA